MWPFKSKPSKTEAWEEKFAALAPLVLASDEVMGPNRLPVCYVYCIAPNNKYDTGLVFLSGNESQKWLDANPPKICPLESFHRMDPSIVDIIKIKIGSAWERDAIDAPWKEVHGFKEKK